MPLSELRNQLALKYIGEASIVNIIADEAAQKLIVYYHSTKGNSLASLEQAATLRELEGEASPVAVEFNHRINLKS